MTEFIRKYKIFKMKIEIQRGRKGKELHRINTSFMFSFHVTRTKVIMRANQDNNLIIFDDSLHQKVIEEFREKAKKLKIKIPRKIIYVGFD